MYCMTVFMVYAKTMITQDYMNKSIMCALPLSSSSCHTDHGVGLRQIIIKIVMCKAQVQNKLYLLQIDAQFTNDS